MTEHDKLREKIAADVAAFLRSKKIQEVAAKKQARGRNRPRMTLRDEYEKFLTL